MYTDVDILSFVDPVLRFCINRLSNRHDAEDLAGEIMLHALAGIRKYPINSLEKWVWRMAYNRYARFINQRNKYRSESIDILDIPDDYDFIDDLFLTQEHQRVFAALHTLSAAYRDVTVDYYVYQMPIKPIAAKYELTETTVKWRLNTSRAKIRNRIGDKPMDVIYTRINWNTKTCNGAFDVNAYLHNQVARAICEAACEKPLSVEDISLKTGLPAMYVEDALPRLIQGDAIVEVNGKYATNFIVLRLRDKQAVGARFRPLSNVFADHLAAVFVKREADIAKMPFYGADFTMKRLGYIAVPALLRCKLCGAIEDMGIDEGPFPPRLDGGYGWFLVDETETAEEKLDDHAVGSNNWGDDRTFFFYLHMGKYFNHDIYRNPGVAWLFNRKIVEKTINGVIPADAMTDEERAKLIKNNLITKAGTEYKFNFPVMTRAEYDAFFDTLNDFGTQFDAEITQIITEIAYHFKKVTPKRLQNQIPLWVKNCAYNVIGLTTASLIERGTLEKPQKNKPLTNGVLCVLNKNGLKI
jgi:RNA polymerase sigma factor (sigma-70 family)